MGIEGLMIEFDAINTADINQFKDWLNKRAGEGWTVIAFQIQNAPGLPVKPFTALVQRETFQVGLAPLPPTERGS